MRALIVILVLANLGFAAWALLVDRPAEPPAARDISHLSRLVLSREPASKSAGGSGSASATTARCVTVGPFSDLAIAAAAASLLQTRGFTPTQRDEPGADLVAYWVYLDNVPSDAAAAQLLQKLRVNGVTDAHAMPITPDETRRVSVGLFTEKEGAERRAHQVKGLGLTPVITEQHQAQATYWVDINLATPGQSVSTEGLLPPAAAGTQLEIRDCPSPASSAPVPGSAPTSAPSAPAGVAPT